jgi:hypothetical protein
MNLRRRLAFILLAASAIPSSAAMAQPAEQRDRVAVSFTLALGRTPAPAELDSWTSQAAQPIAALLERHRQALRDPAVARAVAARAWQDAFGTAPSEEEARTAAGAGLYVDQVQRHLKQLSERPADYEAVVQRVYRLLLDRIAYPEEVTYWRARPTLSYVLLVGCVEDWARRNQPGLMATAGVPSIAATSARLATVRLSPAVAAEARAAAGLSAEGTRAMDAELGRNIVAPGAASVVSVGGVHFAAVGAAKE